MEFLDQKVSLLPRRNTFLDVGAGNGKLTAHFTNTFLSSIAIEPNRSLVPELRTRCPSAKIIESPLEEAAIGCQADFILCSHVFYYLPKDSWLRSLETMANYLGPDGLLAAALQNPETDCMKMLRHFIGGRFDLTGLGREFSSRHPSFRTSVMTVPAMIRTSSLEDACTIAEFMLNLVPMPEPPRYVEVESYVRANFGRAGVFHFSCDQDFLLIQA